MRLQRSRGQKTGGRDRQQEDVIRQQEAVIRQQGAVIRQQEPVIRQQVSVTRQGEAVIRCVLLLKAILVDLCESILLTWIAHGMLESRTQLISTFP